MFINNKQPLTSKKMLKRRKTGSWVTTAWDPENTGIFRFVQGLCLEKWPEINENRLFRPYPPWDPLSGTFCRFLTKKYKNIYFFYYFIQNIFILSLRKSFDVHRFDKKSCPIKVLFWFPLLILIITDFKQRLCCLWHKGVNKHKLFQTWEPQPYHINLCIP